MKVSVDAPDPRSTPRGVDLHLVRDDPTVAKFGAAVIGSRNRPGGEMSLTLLVPFEQVMNAIPVMQYVGGIQFEITVRRVPMDQLPEPGW